MESLRARGGRSYVDVAVFRRCLSSVAERGLFAPTPHRGDVNLVVSFVLIYIVRKSELRIRTAVAASQGLPSFTSIRS